MKGYAYYKSDVIEKIDVNRIEFSAKKTKGENRLGYVSWELVFNGNDEFNATSVTSTVLINPTIYGNDIRFIEQFDRKDEN